MTTIRVDEDETGPVRTGDAVFCCTSGGAYPIHAGIHVGEEIESITYGFKPVSVCEMSGPPNGATEGHWNDIGSNYFVDVVGVRDEDTEPMDLKMVAVVANTVRNHHSGLTCGWAKKMALHKSIKVGDGLSLFQYGTCSHFVEYCYEAADLDIVNQAFTFDPNDRDRIYPSLQIYIFSTGRYGEEIPWCDNFKSYPECVEFSKE